MKNYTKSASILPCKLTKEDLLKLIEIVKEGFPPSDRKEDFEISTHLPNISIKENSIEEFLAYDELPDKFNRLSFRIIGWKGNKENRYIDKSIRMTLYDNYINLYVDGDQQTWVLGKYAQIREFLGKRKPWFAIFSKVFPIISGIIFALVFIETIKFVEAGSLIYSLSSAVFLIAWSFVIILYFKGTFLPYTQIIIRRKGTIINKELIIVIVAIVSLITSIIGSIIIPMLK